MNVLSCNCSSYSKYSPNNDPPADAMLSVLAHELSEAASDPDLDGWYTYAGSENADLCAWKFLTTSQMDGYYYNQVG